MRRRHVERALRFRNVVHAMAEAAISEAMLTHVEAVAFTADQIVRGHLEVADFDLGVAAMQHVVMRSFDRHVSDVALDLVTGVRQLDQEGRMLLVSRRVRVGSGNHQRYVGDAGGRREPLFTVENVVFVAVLHRGRLHARGVGACRLFRHRIADALVATQ
mgnify:CR=1 FL=1